MELRHLRYFLAVAEELNFTRAAERLHVSQPPLSKQIRDLEHELGAPLFDRTNKNVQLTQAGHYFKGEAQKAMSILGKARIKVPRIAARPSGDYRIGYIASTYSETLCNVLERLQERYPLVTFRLFESATAAQIGDLEQGKLDLGILRGPLRSPELQSTLWFRDTYALVYAKDSYPDWPKMVLPDLKEAKFIAYNRDDAPLYYDALMEICARHGFLPNVVHESNNIISILHMVRHGLGISIVPYSLSRTHGTTGLVFEELLEEPLHTEVLLVAPRAEPSEITHTVTDFLISERKEG